MSENLAFYVAAMALSVLGTFAHQNARTGKGGLAIQQLALMPVAVVLVDAVAGKRRKK